MSDTPFRFPNRLRVEARPGSPFPLVELVRDIPTPLQPTAFDLKDYSQEVADA